MKLKDFPGLAKLPKRQRIKLAEELWLSGVDDTLPVSADHREILDERWAEYKSGRANRLTLAELELRTSRKRALRRRVRRAPW